jgi:hypothetical protein
LREAGTQRREKTMKKLLVSVAVTALAAGLALAAPAGKPAPAGKSAPAAKAAPAGATDRWLHIRVEDGRDGEEAETVHVNVPLTLAEKVLPAISADKLHEGKVRLDGEDLKDLDLRAMLQAVRDTQDGEFVTVDKGTDQVRVAKEKGHLVVKVREGKEGGTKVDAQVPMEVVDALLSGEKGELDLAAGVRALARHGEELLVTVTDGGSNVRIWVDSQNGSK